MFGEKFLTTPQVMVDLETLDTTPTAAMLSIGAVKFRPDGDGILTTPFEVYIDVDDCLRSGRTVSGGTLGWWFSPDRETARAAITDNVRNRVSLRTALTMFNRWMGADMPVWGCGSDFDNVILQSSFQAVGLTPVWKFWNNRCYRTLKSMYPNTPVERVGVHHAALADATTQALHIQAIIRSITQEK